MCDKDHIIYLVQAAIQPKLSQMCGGMSWYHEGKRHELRNGASNAEMVAVGNMLWLENLKSVEARYGSGRKDLPGQIEDNAAGYKLEETDFNTILWSVDPVQVLKSCQCYEYQACEHDAWEKSEAKAFVDALRISAIHVLPGYDAAKWGAPKK
jgi:hypothetical protein